MINQRKCKPAKPLIGSPPPFDPEKYAELTITKKNNKSFTFSLPFSE